MTNNNRSHMIFSLASDFVLSPSLEDKNRFHLFNIESGKIYKLNKVTYEFLSLLDGKKQLCDVYALLHAKFAVSPDLLYNDMEEILDKLITHSVLVQKGDEHGKV